MKFLVYCDETLPDLFTTTRKVDKKLMIGSLWIEEEIKEVFKAKIKALRRKHNCWGEIKWTKVSKAKEMFYFELVDLFFSFGMQARFRSIAIDPKEVNWAVHGNDRELGFYKFYYFLLKQWLLDFNEYSIFCDAKVNRDLSRLQTLHKILANANYNAYIKQVQALPSKEVVLIQLADLFLGATSAKVNKTVLSNKGKIDLIRHIEQHLGHPIRTTNMHEQKWNLFFIKLKRGW